MDTLIRQFVRRLLRTPNDLGSAPAHAPEDELLANDSEAYIIFEGAAARLGELTAEGEGEALTDSATSPGAFRIRLAQSQDSRTRAGKLVMRRYSFRGYRLKSVPVDPGLATFVAYHQGHLVGTVSLRFDSPDGLAADELYHPELDELRHSGARLCEFTRLAVDVRMGSKPTLAALFHTAYLLAHQVRQYDTAVIEVNPRHVVFYRRALAFELLGPERLSPRVNAPAVLLKVAFSQIQGELLRFGGKPELGKTTHALFPYGFSPLEEQGILGRLRQFYPATGA